LWKKLPLQASPLYKGSVLAVRAVSEQTEAPEWRSGVGNAARGRV